MQGVVTPAAGDFVLSQVTPVFGVTMAVFGVMAGLSGAWVDRVGPRVSGMTAGAFWTSGWMCVAAGATMHSTPILYLSGLLLGTGNAIGYIFPVNNLFSWFPDRKGMATGLALMGYGGGASIYAPLQQYLINKNTRLPDYLGHETSQNIIVEGGRKFVKLGEELTEVVVAKTSDLTQFPDALEGIYQVGTGSSGVTETMMTIGALHGAIMIGAAQAFRLPKPGWVPQGWTPPVPTSSSGAVAKPIEITPNESLKSDKFWRMWSILLFPALGGMAMSSVAATAVSEVFGQKMPELVTASFGAGFVTAMSVSNMSGRFFWGAVADRIGTNKTYYIILSCGLAGYTGMALSASMLCTTPGMMPLAGFTGSTMLAMSTFGGCYPVAASYAADIFGRRYAAGIFGWMLTVDSMAGFFGPQVIAWMRSASERSSIRDLAAKIDPAKFQEAFSAPVSELSSLIESNAVQIPKLMELVPDGTIDPSPTVYNSTLYSVAALNALGLVVNRTITPITSEEANKLQTAYVFQGMVKEGPKTKSLPKMRSRDPVP